MSGMALLLSLVVLLSIAWVRQPQNGDLARIGGYTESGFGSRLPAARLGFESPRFERVGVGNPAEADVLVLGDSFSNSGGRFNWVSQLAVLGGLSVLVGNVYRWQDILDPDSEEALPPLVILQVVERDAVDLLAIADHRLKLNLPLAGDAGQWQAPRLDPQPISPPLVPLPRKRFADIEERFSVTLDVAWKTLCRALGMPREELVVVARDPGRSAVFSSPSQDDIALIRADLDGLNPSASRYASALRGLEKLRGQAAARGARLTLLVIPNRFSVYRDAMLDPPFKGAVPIAHRLAADIDVFDALTPLQVAMSGGEQDLYWPMDSHLSPVGTTLLAEEFLRWLRGAGLLRD